MRIRVKICGVTNRADAECVARCGADAIGLNFFAGSPRFLSAAQADEIATNLPPFIEPIALFVKESMDNILHQAAQFSWLKTIQWHGDQLPELPETPLRFIVAASIGDAQDVARVQRYLDASRRLPAALLLDARVPGKYGGTGQTAPWHLLRGVKWSVPVILAGGLTPDNVAEAIQIVEPFGVDVAGGVEASPGRKDADKVRRFVNATLAAAATHRAAP